MLTRNGKFRFGFIGAMTLGLLMQTQGEVIFLDTFDRSVAEYTNINSNLVARQVGGTTLSSYTGTIDGGGGSFSLGSNASISSDMLFFRTTAPAASAEYVSVDLDTDFGSSLVGQRWEFSYRTRLQRAIAYGGYTGFAVGNPADTASGAGNGFSFQIGPGGAWSVYSDGSQVGSGLAGENTFYNNYTVTAKFDESIGMVSLSVYFEDSANTVNLGMFSASFSDNSRFFELRNHLDSTTNSGVVDALFDDLKIEVDPSGYAAWSKSYELVEGSTGDDDSDGLDNLYEFGLGGDPTNAADQGVPPEFTLVNGPGEPVFNYVHPQLNDPESGLTYSLELSTNLILGAWANSGYDVTGTNVTGDALDFVTHVVDTVEQQKYIRLAISKTKILYVDDFGAVGDGVQDDSAAVVAAVAALGMIGPGWELEFSEGKTYRLDAQNNTPYQIDLQGMTNVTVNGNGALLLNTPLRATIRMKHCEGVTVKNLLIDQSSRSYTQGTMTSIDPSAGTFELAIEAGYAEPPTGGTPTWGAVFDPTGWLRWDMRSHLRLSGYDDLGAGNYLAHVQPSYTNDLNDVHEGDTYLQPLAFINFDSNIHITLSSNCLLENVTLYNGRSAMSSIVDLNTGRITVRGFKVMIPPYDPSRLISNWADGVHCKDNRIGPIIEDCYFEKLLDDSINLGQGTVTVSEIISPTQLRMFKQSGPEIWTDDSSSMKVGDRIMIFYPGTGDYIGPILVDSVNATNQAIITFDTPISGVVTGFNTSATQFYNLDMSNAGYIVRNNTFMIQRRHAILARAINGQIEGNYIEAVGGNGIALENEFGTFYAGPFPQNVIVSGNTLVSTHLTPIKVNADSGAINTQPVRDIEIAGNTITVSNTPAIELNNVQDVTIHADNLFYESNGSVMLNPFQITNSTNIFYP